MVNVDVCGFRKSLQNCAGPISRERLRADIRLYCQQEVTSITIPSLLNGFGADTTLSKLLTNQVRKLSLIKRREHRPPVRRRTHQLPVAP